MSVSAHFDVGKALRSTPVSPSVGTREIRVDDGEPKGPGPERESSITDDQIVQQTLSFDAVALGPKNAGEIEEALGRFSRQRDRLAAPNLRAVKISGLHQGSCPGNGDGGVVRSDTGQGTEELLGLVGAPQQRVTACQILPAPRVGRRQDHQCA